MNRLAIDAVHTAAAAREVLDTFGVPGRLRHVRDFVWRGGELTLDVANTAETDLCYELRAEWDVAIMMPTPSQPGLATVDGAVVEGRWRRGRGGYLLQVGIDFRVPSAIYVRTTRTLAAVPFVARPVAQVEASLAADLEKYVHWFLDRCLPVPQAQATAAAQLARLHLSAAPTSGTD